MKVASAGCFVDGKGVTNRVSRQNRQNRRYLLPNCYQSYSQSMQWANGLNVQGQPKSPLWAPGDIPLVPEQACECLDRDRTDDLFHAIMTRTAKYRRHSTYEPAQPAETAQWVLFAAKMRAKPKPSGQRADRVESDVLQSLHEPSHVPNVNDKSQNYSVMGLTNDTRQLL